MLQNPNFPGSAPDPAEGAYSTPPEPLADGEGLAAPSQETHPGSRPFGPRFYGSQGL